MFLFFHVEDNGISVEYAYSFLRLIFNTTSLTKIYAFELNTLKVYSGRAGIR